MKEDYIKIKVIMETVNDLYQRQLLGPTALMEIEALLDEMKRESHILMEGNRELKPTTLGRVSAEPQHVKISPKSEILSNLDENRQLSENQTGVN